VISWGRICSFTSATAGGDKIALNYRVVPHAVFAHPQIASVGLTEAAARENHDVRVGVAYYRDTDMGEAMLQEQGFAKAVIDAQTGIVLGFHIIGPYAPMLIQEVVNVMAGGCTATDIAEALHIHPSLTKLVLHAIQNANGPS
jgi:mycothione reductase